MRSALLALVGAVVAVSTVAPLVRAAWPMPALVFALLRMAGAALLLGLAAGRQLGVIVTLPRRTRWLLLGSGLLLGGHFAAWITSLYLTSTAASVALVATQPVFAGLLGWLFLGERPSRRELMGILVATSGSLILTGGDATSGGSALTGDLLALLGAVMAAGYLALGRGVREAVPLLPYLAAVNAIATLTLIAAVLVTDVPVGGHAMSAYVAAGASAVVGSAIGHTLLNHAVRQLPTHLVALAILGEPVGASLLTLAFFGEVPPGHALLGGAVILLGVGLAFAPVTRWRPRSLRGARGGSLAP